MQASEVLKHTAQIAFKDGSLDLSYSFTFNKHAAFLTLHVLATPDALRSESFRNQSLTYADPVTGQTFILASRSNPCMLDPYHIYLEGGYQNLSAKPAILEVTQYCAEALPDEPDLQFEDRASAWFLDYAAFAARAVLHLSSQPVLKGARFTLDPEQPNPETFSKGTNLHPLPLPLAALTAEKAPAKYWNFDRIKELADRHTLPHLVMGETTFQTFIKEAGEVKDITVLDLNSLIMIRMFGSYHLSAAAIELHLKQMASCASHPHLYILNLDPDTVRGMGKDELHQRLEQFANLFSVLKKLNSTCDSENSVYQLPKFMIVSKVLQLASVPMKQDERNGIRQLTDFNIYVVKLLQPTFSQYLVSPYIALDSVN